MLDARILSVASRYWASETGCAPEDFFTQPLRILTHGERLADYDGVFALFREGAAVLSFPPDRVDMLRRRLPAGPLSPALLAEAFGDAGFTVIGPAYIGYAPGIPHVPSSARALGAEDAALAGPLMAACSAEEWDHGGSGIGRVPASGVIADGRLAALAGYEVWDGGIAHISIITHPAYRGRGFGRAAVAHLAARALAAGLLPQYRTLESNAASIRIAESLGFTRYASSVAVRLHGRGYPP